MIYLVLNNEEKGYIMKRKIPKITNSEKQILEVLWDEEKPLTSSEIVGVSVIEHGRQVRSIYY